MREAWSRLIDRIGSRDGADEHDGIRSLGRARALAVLVPLRLSRDVRTMRASRNARRSKAPGDLSHLQMASAALRNLRGARSARQRDPLQGACAVAAASSAT